MKKKHIILIVSGITVIGLFILYLLTDLDKLEKNKKQIKKQINWKETYEKNAKSPYDTYLFYELLKDYCQKNLFKVNEISKPHEKPVNKKNNVSIYFAIGKNIYLNTDNCENIQKFVEEGNYAFIAAETLPYEMVDILWQASLQIKNKWQLKSELNFTDSTYIETVNYTFYYYLYGTKTFHMWSYFDSLNYTQNIRTNHSIDENKPIEDTTIHSDFLDTIPKIKYQVLEVQGDNLPVFVKVPYGKGAYFFHSQPICFTNISMLKERNVRHAEKVISHLPHGDIIWDSYAPLEVKTKPIQSSWMKKESPLQFILRNPPLKWAFYILLTSVFIYILFRSKRKQRIIPPIEEKENTSVEFAETLSGIYMQQQKHKSIALHMKKIWLHYIRDKYHLSPGKDENAYIVLLSKKSGIEEDRIKKLTANFERAQKTSSISSDELIELHEQLEYFYKKCN